MTSGLDLKPWSAIIAILISMPLMSQVIFKDGFEAIEDFKWQQVGANIYGEAGDDLLGGGQLLVDSKGEFPVLAT